jgi:hypothetical protein
MDPQPDFKELLTLLNRHKVEYMIVGAYALAFHGVPRNTGDIDIYVRPVASNAKKVMETLKDFGFGSLNLSDEDFLKPGQVVQLGHPPVRVDILTSISGVSWEQADKGKAAGKYDDVLVHYLGRQEYTANKRATGRKQDLADLEALGEK